MTTEEILKQLIKIPSYVDTQNNEEEIGRWIEKFLQEKTKLKFVRQFFEKKRFNLIAGNLTDPKVLITCHMDTVQPSQNWLTNPLKPILKGGRIYGLGTSDMKSGLAILLSTITKLDNPKGMYLFYGDEEYDFKGMKKFIQEYQNKIAPKLIVSLDGEGLQISNSCRGLIEMTIEARGKSGHAAEPSSGINAISQSQEVISKLKRWLGKFSSSSLGRSTLNVAFILGGTKTKNDQPVGEGNIIANYCKYTIEIRVANENLNAQKIKRFIKIESNKLGLKITNIGIRHDLGNWITPKSQLESIIKAAFRNQTVKRESGYLDIQMLWQVFGKVPTFAFGCGEKEMAHKENEYVKGANLIKAEKFCRQLLSQS